MFGFLGYTSAILGQLFNGTTAVIDKFMLQKNFRASVYAFWVAFTSLGIFLLLPFKFSLPLDTNQWVLDLFTGATFTLAIYFMFRAYEYEEVSRVSPAIGSLIPIFTMFLAYVYLDERLDNTHFWGILVLILGVIFLTFRRSKKHINYKMIFFAFFSAFLFAVSSILIKKVFINQPFISGLCWSRLGGLIIVPFVLSSRISRHMIFKKETGKQSNFLVFILGRFFSAGGFLLINIAFFYISPTIVNALQGIQYALLFILTIVLSKFYPQILSESLNKNVLVFKIAGLLLIILGSIIIAV